jgi:FAD/FMN-containing dehydrogenase
MDPDRRIAWVEPGVILDDLRAAADWRGQTFGPDPSTRNRCSPGGMICDNACGLHSVAYGQTADNVEGLDVLLCWRTTRTESAAGRGPLTASRRYGSHGRSGTCTWPAASGGTWNCAHSGGRPPLR